MTARLRTTLFALTLLTPAAALAEEGEEAQRDFYLDLDVSMLQLDLGFLQTNDFVSTCAPGASCGFQGLTDLAVRGGAAVGVGGTALEATMTTLVGDGSPPLAVFSGGVRFDTSREAVVSVQIRLAYVYRWGLAEGMGGRAGLGLVIHPVWWLAGYAEASAEITTVPTEMNALGALFSYTTYLGGGLRLSFGT